MRHFLYKKISPFAQRLCFGIGLILVFWLIFDAAYTWWLNTEPSRPDEVIPYQDIRAYFPSIEELAEEKERLGDPYEITTLSSAHVHSFVEGKHRSVRYVDQMIHPITYRGEYISFSALSPDAQRFGFFYEPEDAGPFQIILAIMDVETKRVWSVYQAPTPRTSGWEWKDNDHVFVYRNCGTGCRFIEVRNADTGELVDGYHDIEYERHAVEQWCDDPCPLLDLFPKSDKKL